MAFCANCGAEVQGRFCGACGTPVGNPATSGPGSGPSATPPPVNPSATNRDYAANSGGLSENMVSALCYLLWVLTGVLFLVLAPYSQNRTIRFHAWQSIFCWVGWVAIGIGLNIVSLILGHIPFLGWLLIGVLWSVYGLAAFCLWIFLMYKAYQGERFVLPIVGPLAEKQA
jgi:uncharacterized membrane protein